MGFLRRGGVWNEAQAGFPAKQRQVLSQFEFCSFRMTLPVSRRYNTWPCPEGLLDLGEATSDPIREHRVVAHRNGGGFWSVFLLTLFGQKVGFTSCLNGNFIIKYL